MITFYNNVNKESVEVIVVVVLKRHSLNVCGQQTDVGISQQRRLLCQAPGTITVNIRTSPVVASFTTHTFLCCQYYACFQAPLGVEMLGPKWDWLFSLVWLTC